MNKYENLNQERKIIVAKKRVAAYCRVSTDNERGFFTVLCSLIGLGGFFSLTLEQY